MERTLAIIKPDSVEAGNTGNILAHLEAAGFRIVALKKIHLDEDQDLAEASVILGQTPGVASNPGTREIHVPVGGGAAASLSMLRRLDDAGIVITDFQLRRPTLDDVFLTFTDPD